MSAYEHISFWSFELHWSLFGNLIQPMIRCDASVKESRSFILGHFVWGSDSAFLSYKEKLSEKIVFHVQSCWYTLFPWKGEIATLENSIEMETSEKDFLRI
eukprot:TRINITY_DN26841_c1_g1_i1.p1 TRINITY_DN26841_c1_g1~~TRINITY_DN26841_c1_g1_i1.p1  ORF type:complete len:101 (-),score=5.45 TRINITY_DN26841_c1_g1_i1:45-347(-)